MHLAKRTTTTAAALLISAIAITGCATQAPTAGTSGEAADDKLVIASWGGDFSAATLKYLAEPFSEETGIDVSIVDVPGTQATQLQAQSDAGAVQWDILDSLGAADAYFMNQEGLLAPLSADETASFTETLGADKITDFGFSFSSLGYVVVCNNETVTACPATVEEFFDTENFPGRRSVPGEYYSQLAAMLQVASGSAPGEVDIPKLVKPLEDIKDSVSVWYTSGDQMDQVMRQGEADISLHYSGRGYSLLDEGLDATLNWAGVYDPGFTAVAADAPHPTAAAEFMKWVVENAQAQADWSEAMGYSVPSTEALELMPAELSERLADYPANFELLAQQDFDWYLANKDAIDSGIREIVQGG